MTDHLTTPAEQSRLAENQVAVNDELDDMVDAWRFVRSHDGDATAALIAVTDALITSEPSREDLLRLVTYAVGRLAKGGVA